MGWIKAGSNSITNTPTGSPTYSDDFSGTDDWADQGSGVGVNTTTDRLEFSSWTDNTTNNSSTLDLGSALSDTKWVIRFKLHWTGFSNTSDWTAPAIGMFSASSATAGNSNQDMLFYWSIANGATKRAYLSSADNSTISGTDHNLNLSWVTGTTYYVQLQRDGSNFSATVWTGSYEGTEVASGTDTIGGTVSGLQYFGVKSPVTNRGGSFSGWLDDLQIWNNQTAGAEDDLDITSFTANETNQFLGYIVNSGDANNYTSFNDVSTGGKYSRAKSTNGGADSSSGMQNQNTINNTYQTTADHFYVIYGMDISGEDKLFYEHMVDQGSSTGAVQPNWIDYVFKMENNGTTRVTRIDFNNTSTGDYVTGSNLTVLNNGGTEAITIQDGAIYYDTDLNKEYVLYNNTWTEL